MSATADARRGPSAPVDAAGNSSGRLKGKARALDGDTLEIGGTRVRLWGIDAPEKRQSCRAKGRSWNCGGLATAALRSRAGVMTCETHGKDRYGRVLGVCFEGRQDVNAWLVSEGWALAYRRFSKDYVKQEDEARTGKRGMHRGAFVTPWDWRRGKRLPPAGSGSAGSGTEGTRSSPRGLPPLPQREGKK